MRIRRAAFLGLLCCFTVFTVAHASGGYSGVFTPPAVVDRAKFELGKQIYSGSATLASETDPETLAAQQPILARWQENLPKSQKKKVDLPALAGRLSPAQLQALSHFLEVRFRVPASMN
jgi:hypothetical protein